MVVDEHAQLVDDRLADLADVVQPVELAGEALQHLQVGDRADVAADGRRARALAGLLLEEDGLVLPRAFAVIMAISAQATSSRGFMACSGPCAMPMETLSLPAGAISVSARLSTIRRASRARRPRRTRP